MKKTLSGVKTDLKIYDFNIKEFLSLVYFPTSCRTGPIFSKIFLNESYRTH